MKPTLCESLLKLFPLGLLGSLGITLDSFFVHSIGPGKPIFEMIDNRLDQSSLASDYCFVLAKREAFRSIAHDGRVTTHSVLKHRYPLVVNWLTQNQITKEAMYYPDSLLKSAIAMVYRVAKCAVFGVVKSCTKPKDESSAIGSQRCLRSSLQEPQSLAFPLIASRRRQPLKRRITAIIRR